MLFKKGDKMKKFNITGMSCAACSSRVEKAVSGLMGINSCSVNLLTNSMTVDGDVSDEKIIEAVKNAGYGASLVGEKIKSESKKSECSSKKRTIWRLISSCVILLFLMYLSMGHSMWGFPLPKVLADNFLHTELIHTAINDIVAKHVEITFVVEGYTEITITSC